MMSNYQRTMELTGYATNSAGASQKQFEKTMDSLESKLNKLHVVWEQFVTGIANQAAIKGVVGILTALIDGLNKFTDAIDPARTGWSKLVLTIIGFKAAKGIVNGVVRSLGTQMAIGMGKEAPKAATSFSTAFTNRMKRMKISIIGDSRANIQQLNPKVIAAQKELTAAQNEAAIASERLAWAKNHQELAEKKAAAAVANGTITEKHDAAVTSAKTATKEAEAGVTEANIKVKEQEAVVNKLVSNSETRLQKIHSLGIFRRLRLAAVLAGNNAEKQAEVLLNYGLITTDQAEAVAKGEMTVAQLGFNSALEACPIMWIVTAIALVIAGIVMLVSWMNKINEDKAKALEDRMDGAAKATKDAADKAKEAKDAFDDLLETKGTYNKLKEELKELVKGSDEYLKKTQEIKDTISKLVKINPEISKYVTYDENGVPTITPEGIKLAEKTEKEKAYLLELQSQASALKDAWKEYMDQFATSGEDGYVVAGEDLKGKIISNGTVQGSGIAYKLARKVGYGVNADESTGLSTKWFQELGRAYIEKKIVDKQIEGYVQIGKYYIEKATYSKLKNIALTKDFSFDVYDEEYDKTKEGQEHYRHTDARGNYISTPFRVELDDSSLIQAIDQLYRNNTQAFSTLSEKVKFAYKSALMTGLTQQEGVSLSQAEAFSKFYSNKIMSDANITKLIDNFNTKFEDYSEKGLADLKELYKNKFKEDFNPESAGINEDENASEEDKKKNEETAKGYIASRLATQEVFGGKIQTQINTYVKLMKNHTQAFTNVLAIASDNLDDTINEKLLKTLLKGNSALQLLTDEYREVIKELGITEAEYIKYLNKAEANAKESVKSGVELFFKESNENNEQLVEDKIGKKQVFVLGALSKSWMQQVGTLEKDLSFNTTTLLSKFFNTSLFKDAAAAEETFKRLSKIDFSKPSQAAKEIKALAKDANQEYSALGKELTEQTADILSLSRQTKYVWKNIDADTMKDLFKDGAATTEEIKNLCKQLPDMAALLDANSISASTLAKYFNQVQSGMLDIETTSANYLLALDKVNRAQNIITDSLDFVKEFQASESQQKITDSFSEWRTSMKQSLTRGQFGDQNLIDYTKAILGLENWEKYYIEFNGNLQKIEELAFSKINLWKDNFYNMWADFAGKSSTVSLGSAGEIVFDLSNITSIDDLKKQLMETYNISEEVAEAAIADAQTYSSELNKALKELSLGDSISVLLQGGIKDELSKTITIDKKELSSIATEAGLTLTEIINEINKIINEQGYSVKVNDILDINGDLSQEKIDEYVKNIKKQLNTINKEEKKLVVEYEQNGQKIFGSADPSKSINLDKMYTELLSAGMKPDQIKKKMEEILTDATKDLGTNGQNVFYYFKDGVLKAYTGALKEKSKIAQALGVTQDMVYGSMKEAISGGILNGLQNPKVRAQKALDNLENTKETAKAVALGYQIGTKLATARGESIETWAKELYGQTVNALDSAFKDSETQLKAKVDSIDDSKIKESWADYNKKFGGTYSAYTTPEAREGWSEKDKNKDKTTKDSSSSTKNEWTNDWDRQFDVLKKIEALEKRRDSLNKELSRYQKRQLFDEQKIYELKEKQRKNLVQQQKENERLVKDADNWLRKLNKESKFGGSIWWDEEGQRIRTNDAHIRAMDEDTKKEFDKVKEDYQFYYDQRNTALNNISTIIDTLEDLTTVIQELDYSNNTQRLIDVIERTISLYEKAENRLTWTERGVSSQEILNLYKAKSQEATTEFKISTDDFILTEAELNTLLNKKEFQKYYKFDWNTGKVTTTGSYSAITDKEVKERVSEVIKRIEELSKRRSDDDSKRLEVQEKLREYEKQALDKAEAFNKNVYDAIVSQREKEISKLETINSSIQSAAADLVSSIQKNIQKIRQDRTNKKTEEELYKMQSRLDFLQMDTSSGNQKTILDLRKQLEDKEQSYTDSLIDQKISELQDQNTEAEKQRKQQIEVMKTQLEVQKDNGLIWKDVRYLIASGLAANGNIREGSELDKALKEWGKYSSLSEQGKKDWLHEQNVSGSYYDFYYSKGGKDLDYADKLTYGASGSQMGYNALKQYMVKAYKQGLIDSINNTTPYKDYMRYDPNTNKLVQTKLFPNKDKYPDQYNALNNVWKQAWDTIKTINDIEAYFKINDDGVVFTKIPSLARFETGGIADFTGPAWLDGTKTSPELILNARDTENFIQLKDILSSIMSNNITKTTGKGDCYFEIRVDVDKITNDYDVDRMVERIKQQITNSARYRNVNTINLLR